MPKLALLCDLTPVSSAGGTAVDLEDTGVDDGVGGGGRVVEGVRGIVGVAAVGACGPPQPPAPRPWASRHNNKTSRLARVDSLTRPNP